MIQYESITTDVLCSFCKISHNASQITTMLMSPSFAVVSDYGEITVPKEKQKNKQADSFLTCLTNCCFPRPMAHVIWKKMVTCSICLMRHLDSTDIAVSCYVYLFLFQVLATQVYSSTLTALTKG